MGAGGAMERATWRPRGHSPNTRGDCLLLRKSASSLTVGEGGKELPEAEAVLVAGRYRLEAYLAKGGVGAVYRARDESTGQAVALKRMLAHASRSQRLRTLFEREYHTLARLKHPRIIEVYDYGLEDGIPYYTMELLDGKDLGELAPIPFREACFYLRDVASSLALLHSRHLLHRDLSARNVRHTSDDRCKLLDFGTMASFGMATEIVGTPPLVAPESMRGTPLDHRADLYSLGALAYRILTRRYAYRARQLEDLPELWKTAPPPPSSIVGGIPEELDRLVMSLLDLNPVLRPRSASEVIDRLTAIGDLDPDPDLVETAQSYLLSSGLVARDQHMERLTARIKRAAAGTGGTVVIEGNPGVGKTRLLEEAALQSQLHGALTLKVDARAHREPSGVAIALASAMLHTAPHEARRAVKPFEAILAPLVPELTGTTTGTGRTPNVDLATLQQSLAGWFIAMARAQPVVIMVDDLQRVDESSGALLAALARAAPELPLLVVGTRRLAGSVSAPRAMQTLMAGARRIRLHRLKRAGTAELVKGLFGDVPNADKTAQWMHELTTGSPMQTMELSQHLVDTGTIRYTGGLWVLPMEMPDGELPKSLAATMHARAAGLRPDARALAEALSVRRGVLPLTLCMALSDAGTSEEVFALVDELVARGVLVSASGGFAFAQDALRETLLGELGKARRIELHKRIAAALLADERASPTDRLEAGWHLMRAGEEMRGAQLLEEAARKLAPRGDAIASSLPALEAALEVFEREGYSRYRRQRLRAVLTGSFDRGAVQRHAQATIDELAHQAGVGAMRILQPVFGRTLGFWLAMAFAGLRHWLTPPARRGIRPAAALAYFYRCAYSCLTVCTAGMQVPLLEQVWAHVKRFAPAPHLGQLTLDLYDCSTLTVKGQLNRARKSALRARARLENGRAIPGIPAASFHGIQAGAFITLGMIEAQSALQGQKVLDIAEALEQLAERTSKVNIDAGAGYLTIQELERAAKQIRLVYHVLRGESEAAGELRASLELQALQSGLYWQFDIWRLLLEANAAHRTSDLTVLRRNLEQLRAVAGDDEHLAPLRSSIQLSLLVNLGKYEEALQLGQQLGSGWQRTGWEMVLLALSEAYVRTGRADKAVRLLEETLASPFDDRDTESAMLMVLQAALALALATRGDVDDAQRRIDDLVRRTEGSDHPLLRGHVHEVGARIAWLRGDEKLFEAHVQHMRHWYTRTHNAALLSRGQRIASLFRQQAVPGTSAEAEGDIEVVTRVSTKRAMEGVDALMAGCRNAGERSGRALHLIIEQAAGTGGHLYLLKRGRLRLTASVEAGEPQDDLEAAIIRQIKATQTGEPSAQEVDASTAAPSEVVNLGDDDGRDAQYVTMLLRVAEPDAQVVGAVALKVSHDILHPVREIYLRALSACLQEDAAPSLAPDPSA